MPEDPYAPIANLYDLSYGDYRDDIDFYENLAQAVDGPLLELGVGSGRAAIPLVESGFSVVGIDNSPTMLAQARRRLESIKLRRGAGLQLIEGDMTAFELEQRFGLVFLAANTFQHLLSTTEQEACLRCAARHLQPGGILALSVRNAASVSWDDDGPSPLLLDWTRVDPENGETVMKFVASEADAARMVRKLTYVYDRIAGDGQVHRQVFLTELRHSTEAELRLLLQQVGLRVTHVYGDYDLSPVGQGDNLIVVARAEASR